MKLKTLIALLAAVATLTQCKKADDNTDADVAAWANAICGYYENDSLLVMVLPHQGKFMLGTYGFEEPYAFEDLTMTSPTTFTLNSYNWPYSCQGHMVFSGDGSVVNGVINLHIHNEGTDTTTGMYPCADADFNVTLPRVL